MSESIAKSWRDNNRIATADPQQTMARYARELRALNGSTEVDFLSLGASLEGVSVEMKHIPALAGSVIDLVNNSSVKKEMAGLQDLQKLVIELFTYVNSQFEHARDSLSNMTRLIDAACIPLSSFRRVVKHLRMLSVSTKIENARLSHTDNSFDALAQSIENLSTIIDDKTTALSRGLAGLKEIISRTAENLTVTVISSKKHSDLMLKKLQLSFSMLAEKESAAVELASSLSESAEQVTSGVSEVVASLQFHDITRQQIEHVADVLDKMTEADTEAGYSQGQSEPVLGLQIAQLRHANKELAKASDNVLTGLQWIISVLANMSEGTKTLIGANRDEGKSFFVELNNSLSSIMDSLTVDRDADEHMLAAMVSVTDRVEELALFVIDIEDIGSEIELTALNAQIKASHSAQEGASLGVLAEAIRTLSDDTGSRTASMSDTLRAVREAARELEIIGRDEEHMKAKLDALNSKVQELSGEVSQSQQSLSDILIDMDRRFTDFRRSVDNTILKASVRERTERIIGDVCHGLQGFFAMAPENHQDGTDGEYLKQVTDLYTMDRERSIYRTYVSGAPGVTNGYARDHFSDNVELF